MVAWGSMRDPYSRKSYFNSVLMNFTFFITMMEFFDFITKKKITPSWGYKTGFTVSPTVKPVKPNLSGIRKYTIKVSAKWIPNSDWIFITIYIYIYVHLILALVHLKYGCGYISMKCKESKLAAQAHIRKSIIRDPSIWQIL